MVFFNQGEGEYGPPSEVLERFGLGGGVGNMLVGFSSSPVQAYSRGFFAVSHIFIHRTKFHQRRNRKFAIPTALVHFAFQCSCTVRPP